MPVGKLRQPSGFGNAVDLDLEHGSAADADDVGDHRIELNVGILKRLLHPLDVAALLPYQMLAGAQQSQ